MSLVGVLTPFNMKSKVTEMYQVKYQVPYNDCEWKVQSFNTKEEAERMVIFYQSCGSPAHLVG